MSFFDKLYDCISGLGAMPFKIIGSFFKKIAYIFKSIFKKNKKSFTVSKSLFIKLSAVALAVSLTAGILFAFNVNSNKVDAVCLTANGEIVGYLTDQTQANAAKSYAEDILDGLNADIEYKPVKTNPSVIRSYNAVGDLLVEKFGTDLINVYELYINGEYICAVEDASKARECINNAYSLAQNLYKSATVSFSQSVRLISARYPSSSARLFTISELESVLSSNLQILHAQCEKEYADTEFDTVEVQTNKLFTGDSRVRREGKKGKEYNINLVTYIGNEKVISQELMSVPVTQPVSKIVERGIRAQSLSMGEYTVYQTTGMFCWPVVDLYTVTSPYGNRSLGYHRGIDISGASASGKLIVSGAPGTVKEAGWSTGGYGNYVIVDHGNGVETLYAHMLDNSIMVNPGDYVQKGQTIGRVGNTGYSFGAHLHFEVRVNGNRLDPAPFLGLQ